MIRHCEGGVRPPEAISNTVTDAARLRRVFDPPRNDEIYIMNIQDLHKSPLFQGLSDDELQQLMDNAKPVSLRAGEYLMKQGDAGDSAFVVVTGEFEITKQSGQSVIKIDVRNPGDVLGEMALLSRSPRSASVIAITDCETL